MSFQQIFISSKIHFTNLAFHHFLLCYFISLHFPYFAVSSICHFQAKDSLTFHFIKLVFHELCVSSIYCFVNFVFYQLILSSSFHFINLVLHQLSISSIGFLSTCHFLNHLDNLLRPTLLDLTLRVTWTSFHHLT